MRLVQTNENGPGVAKVVAELNQHIEAEKKEGRGGVAGEGQGLSEEDELRIIDDNEDANSRRSASSVQLSVQTHTHTYWPQQQVQPKGRVCWDRFLPVGTLKVLLVESDDSTRHVVTALLRNCSYEVIPVSNGIKAWKYLEDLNNQIDLVLTEVATSGLSGIGLLSKIMSHKSCQNTPVIMMSCHDSMGIVLKCLSKGAADFLVKPIRKNELKNLWQHVWRRCHSSSGSGSESCIRNGKPVGAKNAEDSDNDSDSNDENDNRSIDLQARDGSDNGSGTQSSWRKRAAEVESPQQPPVWNQVIDLPDSTCARVTFPMPEAFASSWMPGATQEHDEQDNQPDIVPMGKDLEIGVPRNTESRLNGPNGKVALATTAEKNQSIQLDLNLKDDGRTSDEENLESNDKSVGEWIKQAKKFPGEDVSNDKHYLASTVSDAPPVPSEKSKSKDVEDLPSLELSLKRLADVADTSTDVTEQNILRHSQLSAFMRYNTGSTGNQGQTGNVGSCSPPNNSSEAAKQSNSEDIPPNQISNSSSNNNNVGSTTNRSFTQSAVAADKAPAKSTVNCTHHLSVFQPVQSSHISKNKFTASGKASAGPVNAVLVQENDVGQQVNFQHQHQYHHHNVHCVQQLQNFPAHVDMSKSMDGIAPQCGSSNNCSGQTEANVANCSLNGSASGSNHGSNCLNGSSAVVNAEGTNMVNDSGMAAKDGTDNGSGSGSGSGVDQSRSAQREAALNKFRLKRKERCFDKKVRYQSRKQLADQRPRVRGQFVRRDRETKGRTADS